MPFKIKNLFFVIFSRLFLVPFQIISSFSLIILLWSSVVLQIPMSKQESHPLQSRLKGVLCSHSEPPWVLLSICEPFWTRVSTSIFIEFYTPRLQSHPKSIRKSLLAQLDFGAGLNPRLVLVMITHVCDTVRTINFLQTLLT